MARRVNVHKPEEVPSDPKGHEGLSSTGQEGENDADAELRALLKEEALQAAESSPISMSPQPRASLRRLRHGLGTQSSLRTSHTSIMTEASLPSCSASAMGPQQVAELEREQERQEANETNLSVCSEPPVPQRRAMSTRRMSASPFPASVAAEAAAAGRGARLAFRQSLRRARVRVEEILGSSSPQNSPSDSPSGGGDKSFSPS